jgi:hypothetical protein
MNGWGYSMDKNGKTTLLTEQDRYKKERNGKSIKDELNQYIHETSKKRHSSEAALSDIVGKAKTLHGYACGLSINHRCRNTEYGSKNNLRYYRLKNKIKKLVTKAKTESKLGTCSLGHLFVSDQHGSDGNDINCTQCQTAYNLKGGQIIKLLKDSITVRYKCKLGGHSNVKSFSRPKWNKDQHRDLGVYSCLICDKQENKIIFDDEFIKNYLFNQKYILLKNDVSNHKLTICPLGHLCKVDFNLFYYKSKGCQLCESNKPKCIVDIRNLFLEQNYDLISSEYTFDKLLKYRCENGHQKTIKLNDFINGSKCPK